MRFGKRWTAVVVALLGLALVACQQKPTPAKKEAPAKTEVPPETEASGKTEAPAKGVVEPPDTGSGQQIVDRALEASGGAALLEKTLSAMTAESHGDYMGSAYNAKTWWQTPDKFVMQIHDGLFEMGSVGKTCWHSYCGVVVDCPPGEAESGARMTRVAYVMNLFPLKSGDWTLKKVDDEVIEGTKCSVIRVSGGILKAPITLYFNQENGLMHGASFKNRVMGTEVENLIVYTGYREVEGMTLPAGSKTFMDGKYMMTEEMGETAWGKADPAAFEKPSNPPSGTVELAKRIPNKVLSTTVTGPYESAIGLGMGKLFGWLSANGGIPMGGPSMLWIKGPTHTENPDAYVTEVRVPFAMMGELPKLPDGVTVKDLPEMTVVRSIEMGSFPAIATRYPAIAKWAVDNGFEITGPAAADTLGDPSTTPPDKILNVLWFPVAKKAAE